jgi:hypothetical protein
MQVIPLPTLSDDEVIHFRVEGYWEIIMISVIGKDRDGSDRDLSRYYVRFQVLTAVYENDCVLGCSTV